MWRCAADAAQRFALNEEQARVLARCVAWVTPTGLEHDDTHRDTACKGVAVTCGDPMPTDAAALAHWLRCEGVHSTDVVLAHGVFGAGKSHMLVAIASCLAQLAQLGARALKPQGAGAPGTDAASAAEEREHSHVGSERDATSDEQAASVPLRVLVAAATNVAVDRVLLVSTVVARARTRGFEVHECAPVVGHGLLSSSAQCELYAG